MLTFQGSFGPEMPVSPGDGMGNQLYGFMRFVQGGCARLIVMNTRKEGCYWPGNKVAIFQKAPTFSHSNKLIRVAYNPCKNIKTH